MKKQEAQRPRGPRYPKGPKHTETPLTRCYHNEDLIPTELSNTTLDLRGPEAKGQKKPRGPKSPEAQNPQRPRDPEPQRPRGPRGLRPKRPIHHQLMFILDGRQKVLDCDQQRLLSRDPLWRHVHGAGGSSGSASSSVSVQVKFNLLQMYRSAQ